MERSTRAAQVPSLALSGCPALPLQRGSGPRVDGLGGSGATVALAIPAGWPLSLEQPCNKPLYEAKRPGGKEEEMHKRRATPATVTELRAKGSGACNCDRYLKVSKETMAHLMKARGLWTGEEGSPVDGSGATEAAAGGSAHDPSTCMDDDTLELASQRPIYSPPACQ
ncbi:hypothetical protein JD844_005109 [Phrynosoma platyrhinos]|uniref:Uncharacterized protein n=1 Tax=Phrynosoma platyrhinos TaxID=52577 RepID=A0ABQ7SEA0_PHRPL|nr:hypothetical protein JD844_005109 [Phrynosoma platyrhinos]